MLVTYPPVVHTALPPTVQYVGGWDYGPAQPLQDQLHPVFGHVGG